jgi:hypothetical protein
VADQLTDTRFVATVFDEGRNFSLDVGGTVGVWLAGPEGVVSGHRRDKEQGNDSSGCQKTKCNSTVDAVSDGGNDHPSDSARAPQ